ncbi:MAG: hypothetical protein AAF752_01235 [Bacteroidota bacterium]
MHNMLTIVWSFVIAGVIGLVLYNSSAKNQDVALRATMQRAAQTALIDVFEMIEHDVKNIGSGETDPRSAIQYLPKKIGADSVFSFRTRTVYGDTAKQLVEYRWFVSDTVYAHRVGKPSLEVETYSMERRVDGVLRGRSDGTITSLNIVLRDGDNQAVSDPRDAELVFVELKGVSRFGAEATPDGDIVQSRWRSTFRPLNLSN